MAKFNLANVQYDEVILSVVKSVPWISFEVKDNSTYTESSYSEFIVCLVKISDDPCEPNVIDAEAFSGHMKFYGGGGIRFPLCSVTSSLMKA